MNELKKFNTLIIGVALAVYILMAIVFYFIIPELFHYSLILVPVLLALVTSLLHKKLILAGQERPIKFINMFMAVTGIKLMIYLVAILLYVMFLTDYAIPFIAIFFTLYIIYTILEIKDLLKYLKGMEKN